MREWFRSLPPEQLRRYRELCGQRSVKSVLYRSFSNYAAALAAAHDAVAEAQRLVVSAPPGEHNPDCPS